MIAVDTEALLSALLAHAEHNVIVGVAVLSYFCMFQKLTFQSISSVLNYYKGKSENNWAQLLCRVKLSACYVFNYLIHNALCSTSVKSRF